MINNKLLTGTLAIILIAGIGTPVFADNGIDDGASPQLASPQIVPVVNVDQIILSSGKQIGIYEGIVETDSGQVFSATLSGFNIDAVPSAKMTLISADGQGPPGGPGTAAPFSFNTGVFPNSFVSADGLYWDTITNDVTAFVSPGDITATVVQDSSVTNDCLVHQAIIFEDGTLGALGGYAAAGVGLRNTGSGIITIAGIPASDVPVKALLYWNILNPTTPSNTITFDANPVVGTLIGTDGDPCWGQTTTWGYRADVTSLISGNGNGAHSITLPSVGLREGASLVIIHDSKGPVGGELLPIDNTVLLLAGLQTSSIWMIPTLAGLAGSGFYLIKFRTNKD